MALPKLQLLIDAFEQQWSCGTRPNLRAQIKAAAGNGATKEQLQQLLAELLPIDMEYQAKLADGGVGQPLDAYLNEFNDLLDASQPPLDLILEEYRVRHRWGDRPSPKQYANRFPHVRNLADALQRIDEELEQEQDSLDLEVGSVQELDPQAFRLEVTSGPHEGQSFSVSNYDTLIVGRSRRSQLRLNQDPHFSRFHFRLEINPPVCRLVDLQSTSGTFVNGDRKTEALLSDGDTISGGQTEMLVRIKEQASDSSGETPKPALAETADFSPPTDELPEELGEYQITRRIGAGSMGVVLHAIQRNTQRPVALKLITPETEIDNRALQMFVREASILCQLQHRRIVESIEFGLHERRMYLAMEYLEVENLHELLAQQSRPRQVRLACGVVERVLEALQYAHTQDIVHRDVKPANILAFRRNGKLTAKLGDFGLAKCYVNAGMSAISQDGEVKGTIAYMAPEQIIECRHAKPPCDVYSAGACLYHFLSGRPPYQAEDARSALALILNEDPTPIQDLAPDLPDGLASLVSRAMAREPSARFSSAEHMRQALSSYSKKSDA